MARVARFFGWLLLALLVLLLLAAAWAWWAVGRGRPAMEGEVSLPGLSAPVTIQRDEKGTPTITGATRQDVAVALGYLHGQERFFRMDAMRRYAAGELSALMGDSTLKVDEAIRVHRFRARARQMVAALTPDERRLMDAYVAGVNRGLADLPGRPFEYWLLRTSPRPWQTEDSVLAVFAMYLNLQPATPRYELDVARAEKAVGPEMAAFLYPITNELDAPIDGSKLPEPPMPTGLRKAAPAATGAAAPEPAVVGSNNWAVSGAHTATGAALVANDMHLGLDVPAIWFRARMIVRPAPGSSEQPLDATGVTLPGTPFLVAGSNRHIAWGYTNSYIDTSDAVIGEWVDEKAGRYRTPAGPQTIRRIVERLCVRADCRDFPVRETIWGPIIGKDAFGHDIAMQWTAHAPDAIRLAPALAMEQAKTVPEALAIAHQSGIPQQNFTVGDSSGNIAWTIIGRVPRRFGFDGRHAVSFADGTKGWNGYLSPEETPTVVNPVGGRIWTANARVVGGDSFAKLGFGGYDTAARAGRIRDRLLAREQFAPKDFLSIQLDDTATRNIFWQQQLLAELARRPKDAKLQALVAPVQAWGERAVPDSVGYRIVNQFRQEVVNGIYEGWIGKPDGDPMRKSWVSSQAEGPVRRLLRERPAGLVPPGAKSWDAFLDHALAEVLDDIAEKAGGDVKAYRWGEVGKAGVRHPLSRAIPGLSRFLDPPDVSIPGDAPTVRAAAPGFGASERFAVSPGREEEGLFHMPGGQAGNPRTPWYLAGHDDWVEGRATPFLPGKTRWTLELRPAAAQQP